MTDVPANPEPFPPFGVHASEQVYDSPWCGLRRDTVVLPNGRLQEYHVLELASAVGIVPVLPDGRVVLCGQYRYTHGNTHWETPAGRIDQGEDPAVAAARECLEETGYRPRRVEPLPGFYPTNGISAHYAHLFVGHDCELIGEQALDDSEQITAQVFTRGEVEALLDAGRFADGFTAIAVLYWLRRQES
ncbi:MAG: NUDIX hydrolase [Planctomycetota bacterium]|nr:NUDIX hydrolase [Planctomycetota bacterium]